MGTRTERPVGIDSREIVTTGDDGSTSEGLHLGPQDAAALGERMAERLRTDVTPWPEDVVVVAGGVYDRTDVSR